RGSRRTPRSSTSASRTGTSQSSTRSTTPAAPRARSNTGGGETAGMTDGRRPRSSLDDGSPESVAANPGLSDGQLARLRAYGTPDELDVGEAAFAAGDPTYDLIVIEEG